MVMRSPIGFSFDDQVIRQSAGIVGAADVYRLRKPLAAGRGRKGASRDREETVASTVERLSREAGVSGPVIIVPGRLALLGRDRGAGVVNHLKHRPRLGEHRHVAAV